VDTGIDYTHPKLRDHIWVNQGEAGLSMEGRCSNSLTFRYCNGIDDDKDGFADDFIGWDFVHEVPFPYDTHGHGTHISGIIVGNAEKLAEQDGDCIPNIRIMPLKYYDNNGYNNLTNTVRAFKYAVDHGADVINYSGGGADPSDAERRALVEAEAHGIIVVAAAGNDGESLDSHGYFPATYGLPNIISVANSNKANTLLPSSNYGKRVSLAAPGLMILSSLPEGREGTMSGTSQSTAAVTSLAASLISRIPPGKKVSYAMVKSWILKGSLHNPLKSNKNFSKVQSGVMSPIDSMEMERNFLKKNP
jgi:subtilisin family serine protease